MGQGELEVLLEELLDVGAADVGSLGDLNDLEDLKVGLVQGLENIEMAKRTWMDRKRARWRAAISWYRAWTASQRDISRYSLYMLWVPERES